jgi:hypothetical protein
VVLDTLSIRSMLNSEDYIVIERVAWAAACAVDPNANAIAMKIQLQGSCLSTNRSLEPRNGQLILSTYESFYKSNSALDMPKCQISYMQRFNSITLNNQYVFVYISILVLN